MRYYCYSSLQLAYTFKMRTKHYILKSTVDISLSKRAQILAYGIIVNLCWMQNNDPNYCL